MFDGVMLQAIFGLVVTILIIFAVAFIFKRFFAPLTMNKIKNKKIKVLEATMLDPRHRLFLVEWEGKEYMFLLGGQQPLQVDAKLSSQKKAE